MIADVPGMRLLCNGSGIRGCKVESSRSAAAGFSTEGCELNVHLDGIKLSSRVGTWATRTGTKPGSWKGTRSTDGRRPAVTGPLSS